MDLMNEKKLKIAMLGHKRVPSKEGGVEVVVGELARRMVQLGHEVTLYNRSGEHIAGDLFTEKNIDNYYGARIKKVVTLNIKGMAAVSSSFFASLCAAFGDYDVVHVHAEGPALWCGLIKKMGKRVVVTIHGLDWERAKWSGIAKRLIKRGEKNAVKYADNVIVLSKNNQAYFAEKYGREVTYIPNGVNIPQYKSPRLIQNYGLKKDSYVLFVGRLVPEKGLQYLLEAWKYIDTDKILVIAGGESDSKEYATEIKRKEYKNVLFTGFVQGLRLEELYSNAYLYVIPSDVEGMPLTLLEAMSYENCCLTSDIPECTEIYGDAAISFARSNVEDLREKIVYLLENPQVVNDYRKKAFECISSNFRWNSIVDNTLDMYTDEGVSE